MSESSTALRDAYEGFCAAYPLRRRQIDGVCWEYICCGAGAATLLLLPGGLGEAATSFQYCLAFAPQYRVLSLSYPSELRSVVALADGVAALLEAEGVAQSYVVGGSYSGMVAQALVRRHPQRVAALALAFAGVPRPGRGRWLRALLPLLALPTPLLRTLLQLSIYGFLRQSTPDHRFWRGYFHSMLGRITPQELRCRLEVASDFDLHMRFAAGDLAAWPGALLILEAAHDGFFGVAERAALRRLYPQARVLSFAHGHSASLDRPEAMIAALAAFFAEVAV